MVNVDKLRGKIVECRMTVDEVAKAIGSNAATLYRRLNGGGGTFTIDEADKIAKILSLTADELNIIFLHNMSHKTRNTTRSCVRW